MSWALPGAILFLLGLMLLLGYFLSMKVFPSERRETEGADPSGGSPCEGCTEAGCGGFAKALVRGGSDPPGGTAVTCDPAGVGTAAGPREMTAAIRCMGSSVSLRYRYSGAPSCRVAARMAPAPKECANACLGFGDCVRACPARAILIESGIARVDPSRCDGCGDCLGSCPLDLIVLVPPDRGLTVLCKGAQGPAEGWTCPDGCTACGLCIEACPEDALERTENGPPRWIESRCTGCGACAEACPPGVVALYGSPPACSVRRPSGRPPPRAADHPASSR